jgi:hypothetical protein
MKYLQETLCYNWVAQSLVYYYVNEKTTIARDLTDLMPT